jgi:type I restriction enzyme S subunit
MKRPAYPKYKPSGIEWLGEVPEHWDVKRLKYSASINDEALSETTTPDFEFRYVDISSVDPVDGVTSTEEMVFESAPSRARRIVRDGDTIVSTVRTYLRAIAPIHKPGTNLIVSTGFAVVRPRNVRSRFLSYALREASFVETVVARSVGVSYPAVNASDVATIPTPLPSPDEQDAIADYLDRETANIDALVAKKRELIEKLKEKRTALISRTVTRGLPPDTARAAGLDPNPKLKPTGIEWLGDVPEHWAVCAVWHLFFLGRGRVISHEDIAENPGEYPVYSSQTENDGVLGHLGGYDFEGDYITWTTDGANAGTVFRRMGRFNCTNVCGTLKAKAKNMIDTRFGSYSLGLATGEFVRHDINPKLMNNVMAKIRIGIPPLKEQHIISEYLDCETMKLDALAREVQTAIERLQEYRTALITAAVTGKIDVRKEAA